MHTKFPLLIAIAQRLENKHHGGRHLTHEERALLTEIKGILPPADLIIMTRQTMGSLSACPACSRPF